MEIKPGEHWDPLEEADHDQGRTVASVTADAVSYRKVGETRMRTVSREEFVAWAERYDASPVAS